MPVKHGQNPTHKSNLLPLTSLVRVHVDSSMIINQR
ncbi:uncharacterized protein G2W53_012318 [Senna tora]|uniref:Uncharacterized protein n=1 Tax=Senna tora TaxID=362788 RepID=A0A834WNG3_9FABA|nr:uncharacterized protein G2W53_012318 [Senna tora]